VSEEVDFSLCDGPKKNNIIIQGLLTYLEYWKTGKHT